MPAVLHWFRHDLRLHDNAALQASLALAECEGLAWLPVWWAGERWSGVSPWGMPRAGAHRQAFLNQALADLDRSLRAWGSGLMVLRDPSPRPLLDLAQSAGAVAVVAEDIAAPDEQDEVAVLEAKGLRVQTVWQSSLLDPADLPWDAHAVPDVFTVFRQGVERAGVRAPEPRPAPTRCPPWPETLARPPHLSEPEALPPGAIDARSSFPYGQAGWNGGETAALGHLAQYLARNLPHTYKTTRNQLSGADFSSKWSPWLASGAMSPRAALAGLRSFEAERGASDGSYWLWFELLWRDHFRLMHRKHGRRLYRAQGLSERPEHRAPMLNASKFAQWCAGQTGQLLVDAGMRELSRTGFLSNRMRQIVASHWLHGMGGDWRAGAAWFESQLLDFDVHSNTGNWLYIAGRGTNPRGGRAFDLAVQAKRHDPDGVYRAMWR
jgi:deoxyribodipyrimidine photo-lyase